MLSDARKTNDFGSLSSAQQTTGCCGKPELSRESVACEDGSVKVKPVDSNNTMDKVLGVQGSLIEQFIGEDLGLRDEVIKVARRQVELKLKAEMRRQQKNSAQLQRNRVT